MKERPILFSAPMVRAILDGRKTQTRRIVKVPWKGSTKTTPYEPYYVDDGGVLMVGIDGPYRPFVDVVASPYGVVGDRLWVRETWAKPGEVGDSIEYRADNDDPLADRWRPSIYMPRWASRITLEVTGVRVERLQDISEDDARAEGVSGPFDDLFTPKVRFEALWESINGADSWDANPWVWVVEFRRL